MYTPLQYQELINGYLKSLVYDPKTIGLYEPIQYVLSLGGKRLRPVLMLMAYHLYKDDAESILPVAVGLETYHNFTLLHDDVMDKADMRRGKPTVHVKWNENAAILSGDAMAIQAYQRVSEANPAYLKPVLDLFSKTVLEICEGQQLDIDFEHRQDVTEAEYIEMIRLKTSVLLACALQMGAIQAGASTEDCSLLYTFGEKIGLAFQLQDDFLDVYGDPSTFGKNIGGDILCNKKTYLLINASLLTKGADAEELNRWIAATTYDKAEKIRAVTALYNKEGVNELAKQKIRSYYDEARTVLNQLSVPQEKKEILWNYAASLMNRTV